MKKQKLKLTAKKTESNKCDSKKRKVLLTYFLYWVGIAIGVILIVIGITSLLTRLL